MPTSQPQRSMKCSVLYKPQFSRIEAYAIPPVGPYDVLVKVAVCGACTSELPKWQGSGVSYPLRLGHEVAGVVAATGSEVTELAPGRRVTGLFFEGFSEYAVAHKDRVTPIPAGIGYEEAVGEPLSCVISGVRRMRLELGDTIAIVGLGFMGLLTLQAVRLRGAARIIAVDIREDARQWALRFGATEVYHPDEVPAELKLTERRDIGHRGADAVIECSGTQPGLTLAGQMVKEHGFLSIVGYHQEGPREVDMQLWNWKAISVLNAHERRPAFQMDCMRRGLRLLAANRIDTASLITHRFALSEVDKAYALMAAKPAGFVKSLIVMD